MASDDLGTIVVVSPMVGEDHLNAIRTAASDREVIAIRDRDEWQERRDELAPTVEVIYGISDVGDPTSLPRLRWMQTLGAGTDWLLRSPNIVKSDIMVTNGSGVAAVPIAEHVLALMFALSRRLHRFVEAQSDHEWFSRGRAIELDGSTMGVIGLGAIGEKTAEKARGLNMRVIGLRRDPSRSSPHVDLMLGPEGLTELLESSDWVVIATALTNDTRNLIGEPELRAMKDTAYLINIARGAVVQEEILVQALREGWIGGAGLDVFEREPLPSHSPLWDMRNVIITPHFAGHTPHYADRIMEIFVDNIKRYLAGKPLINVIDKKRSY